MKFPHCFHSAVCLHFEFVYFYRKDGKLQQIAEKDIKGACFSLGEIVTHNTHKLLAAINCTVSIHSVEFYEFFFIFLFFQTGETLGMDLRKRVEARVFKFQPHHGSVHQNQRSAVCLHLSAVCPSREASESGPKAQTRERSKARFIKSRTKIPQSTCRQKKLKIYTRIFRGVFARQFCTKLTHLTRSSRDLFLTIHVDKKK